MNNNNQKPNLIARLNTIFHSPIIKNTISALIMAGAIAISANSCSLPPKGPSSSDVETNNKGQNNINKYSQYTELLQNVLNNEYYNQLIGQAEADFDFYKTGYFDPHPYAFLEDEGYDIQAIKDNEIECYTMSYILDEEPNNLYMYTRVANEGDFYTNYLVKYTLTDKEMKDYKLTHEDTNNSSKFYIQSVFMNNEISELKTPTIVGESNISFDAFKKFTKDMENRSHSKSDWCDIIMINPSKEDYTFDLILIPRIYKDDEMIYSSEINYLKCNAAIHETSGIFTGPYTFGEYLPLSNEPYKATLFYPQKTYLAHMYCEDLTKN